MGMFDVGQSPNIGTSSSSGMGDYSSLLQMLMKQQQSPQQAFASAIPGIQFAQNMGKYNQPANQLAAGMGDLNNPLYQQLYGQFKQQGMSNLAQQLQMMEGRNRTLGAMGRVPLFAPERNGEQAFRQMMQGGQDVANNASQQALGQMNTAYNAAHQQSAANMQVGQTKANVNSNLLGALAKMIF